MIQDKTLPFEEYVHHAKEMILRSRTDLTAQNNQEILEAVSPFEWASDNHKNGVLLIHGLYDTPFILHDIGKHFSQKKFLVRGILLPGHGTQPDDLLNVSHQDWLDTVEYGIKSMSNEVENLYIVGYSMGATLSMLSTKVAHNLRGLIMIAPGLKPMHQKAHFLPVAKLLSRVCEKTKWYNYHKTDNFLKYFKHPYHAANEAMLVMKKAQKTSASLPLFVVASADDETVDPMEIVHYFEQLPNPTNRFIYYSNNGYVSKDARIEVRKSSYPSENIINFSHRCLAISPDNHYLGRQGKFLDYAHYKKEDYKNANIIMKGAVNKENLAKYTIQRLSYNPDFDYLVSAIDKFIGRT